MLYSLYVFTVLYYLVYLSTVPHSFAFSVLVSFVVDFPIHVRIELLDKMAEIE